MSDQQPPAWNPNNPTGPYDAPPDPTRQLPQYGPPQQYNPPPHQTAPLQDPSRPQQPYGAPPHQTAPLPQYGQPQYGPPQPGVQPQYGFQPPPYDQQPPKRSRGPWLTAAAAVVVLALLGGAVVFLTRGDDTAEADAPSATATYTDGITTPGASPTTEPPTTEPPTTDPPSPTTPPPVGERRRTLKDIDVGIAVYDDIYVNPAPGWRKTDSTQRAVILEPAVVGRGGAVVAVSPLGVSARFGVAQAVDEMIAADRMKGVEKGDVQVTPPANSNIGSQAAMSYSGRVTASGGLVARLVGRCTTMAGVETVHNVMVTLCVVATKDAQKAVFHDADRMLASVARSI